MLRNCEEIDPKTPAEQLQYGNWMKASPMKTKKRGAETELQEERKLYMSLKGSGSQTKAKQKLNFVTSRVPTVSSHKSSTHNKEDGGKGMTETDMEINVGSELN